MNIRPPILQSKLPTLFSIAKRTYQTQPGLIRRPRSTSPELRSTMGSVTTASSPAQGPFDVKKIAIVGAGPCGLAAAKYLLAEDAFDRIDVFEQQAEVGGVWKYSAEPSDTLCVPQTDAYAPPEPPLGYGSDSAEKDGGDGGAAGGGAPVFPSPMYEDLHTNIPHTLMKYSDLDFPAGCEIFPSRQVVQDYLVEYAKDVRHLIKFSTQVTDIALRETTVRVKGTEQEQVREQVQERWDIRTTDLLSRQVTQTTYDAVVVASGHYSTPYIPDHIADIARFNTAHPGVISHSKLYRNPAPYADKKVVIVGNGASGLDIASQIRRVCKQPLLVSAQTQSPPETLAHVGVEEVGQIERFLVDGRGVRLQGSSSSSSPDTVEGGRVETDVDAVVFCTGYLYTFPFLTTLADPPLVTDGRRVHGLSRHLLHIRHPTLSFPGLPMKVIPFPLAEAQAAVFGGIWANRLPLPPRGVLEGWEREDEEVGRETKGFHVFPKGGDGKYINEMHDWAMQARDGGGGGKGSGKEPPYWGEELLWQRSIYAQAKMQFEKMGKKAKSLQELGFVYEPEAGLPEDAKKKDPHLDIAG